ncbi:hypothetical protein CERSUDRAFT_99804 [Gelatoporia subvermispora B]|uniref:Uncharacterized protein n=1 Tax=Ceriporiopsis subvermispora (strain B) TaxID=914234 RepID=M2QZU0_CERS8|nr:hypothetical protein CERSUDRAFT_99804 [Gelatoporia subvermispora B]
MLTHASKQNVRMVVVNLRDYPGSTPYSQEELGVIVSHDAQRQSDFMQARGLEIATFIEWLIRKEDLAKISEDAAQEISGESCSYPVGCPLPTLEEFYCPFQDPANSPMEIVEGIPLWVSAYYKHDTSVLESFEDFSLSQLASGLSSQALAEPRPSVQSFSPEEYDTNLDRQRTAHSYAPFLFMERSTFYTNARRALHEKLV